MKIKSQQDFLSACSSAFSIVASDAKCVSYKCEDSLIVNVKTTETVEEVQAALHLVKIAKPGGGYYDAQDVSATPIGILVFFFFVFMGAVSKVLF